MGLLANAVAIANGVTLSLGLQASVTHEAFLGQNARGDRSYGPPVARPALVTLKNRSVVTSTGELTVSNAQIVFLDASVIIGDDDRITMPDGTTQPIIDRRGFIDPGTGRPILTEVFLG